MAQLQTIKTLFNCLNVKCATCSYPNSLMESLQTLKSFSVSSSLEKPSRYLASFHPLAHYLCRWLPFHSLLFLFFISNASAHLPSSVSCNLIASLPIFTLSLSSCLDRSRSHSPGRRDRRGASSERRREERERDRRHPSSSGSGLPRGHSRSR